MNSRTHRIAVAVSPFVMGVGATMLQALTVHHFDPWVMSTSALIGALSMYWNYLRGNADPTPLPPTAKP